MEHKHGVDHSIAFGKDRWALNEIHTQEHFREELSAVTAERDALAERLEDTFPATWAGLQAFLDHWYPADIFAQGNDPGPRIIRLTRELSELRARVERTIRSIEEWGYSRGMHEISYHETNLLLAILEGTER